MKVGIDIGGSHIAIGVVDNNGKIIEKVEKRWTAMEKRNLKKAITEYILEKVKLFQEKYKIERMGIGTPGQIENGIMVKATNLQVRNFNIIEDLKELELPIMIRNDAKVAGLAENTYGCLKGYNSSLFLTLGTGIGGAYFLHGDLQKAGDKAGYKFGHMVIQKDGITCNCGRKGCFERYASMKAFKNHLREALKLDETTRGQELLEMIRRNTPENKDYQVIEDVVNEYIKNLSEGIQNLICIFEPEIIRSWWQFCVF